ncbi:hypothetical protein T492DRAFT_890373 [Pavlovales sp. CCMP2436]|nr:hypothetical protein T492DRAFT_890373 [Pavlovales sp. CCMP2436]
MSPNMPPTFALDRASSDVRKIQGRLPADKLVGTSGVKMTPADKLVGTSGVKVTPADKLVGTSGVKMTPADKLVGTSGVKVTPADALVGTSGVKMTPADALVGTSGVKMTPTDALDGTSRSAYAARLILGSCGETRAARTRSLMAWPIGDSTQLGRSSAAVARLARRRLARKSRRLTFGTGGDSLSSARVLVSSGVKVTSADALIDQSGVKVTPADAHIGESGDKVLPTDALYKIIKKTKNSASAKTTKAVALNLQDEARPTRSLRYTLSTCRTRCGSSLRPRSGADAPLAIALDAIRSSGADTPLAIALDTMRSSGADTPLAIALDVMRTSGADTPLAIALDTMRSSGADTPLAIALDATDISGISGADTPLAIALSATGISGADTPLAIALGATDISGADTPLAIALSAMGISGAVKPLAIAHSAIGICGDSMSPAIAHGSSSATGSSGADAPLAIGRAPDERCPRRSATGRRSGGSSDVMSTGRLDVRLDDGQLDWKLGQRRHAQLDAGLDGGKMKQLERRRLDDGQLYGQLDSQFDGQLDQLLIGIVVVDCIEQLDNSRTASDDLNRDRALKALQILPKKPDGVLRSIGMGCILRAVLTKAVMHEGVSRKIATVVGPQQVAVGVKSGISMSVFGATIHLSDDPGATTIKTDVQKAFGIIERSAVVEQPLLAP